MQYCFWNVACNLKTESVDVVLKLEKLRDRELRNLRSN